MCRDCRKAHNASYRANNKERIREQHREETKTVRDKAIEGYGSRCVCCGEIERVFLTLDHVNGGGNQERKHNSHFAYRDAIKRGFPPDYQVLCFNCNWAKHALGVCPHQLQDYAKKEIA